MCLQPSDVDKLSNEEILELRKKGIKLHPDNWASVVKLTPQHRRKGFPRLGRRRCRRLRSERTRPPVRGDGNDYPRPCVRCVVKRQWDFLIVMDYIPG
jgi:hypothetical protein